MSYTEYQYEDDLELSDLTDGGIVDKEEIEEYSQDFGIAKNTLENLSSPEFTDFRGESNIFNTSNDDLQLIKCFENYLKSLELPGHDPEACLVRFDGVSCWPETSQGSLAIIPCFTTFNGVEYEPTENNATRFCHANGTWSNRSFYDFCMDADVTNSTGEDPGRFMLKNAIFYSGYILTLVAVSIALWIFLTFKDLRCLRNTIHTNLLFTYFLQALVWIIFQTVQSHLQEEIECVFYSSLQYFVITNFMWMFVEGFYLYMLVVKTFEVETIKLRVYVLLGWGIPLPINFIWVLVKSQMKITLDSAQTDEELEAVGLEPEDIKGTWINACRLMANGPVDWIHKIAVLLLLSINIVFLMRIMWVLITKLRSQNNVETLRYRKATKALLVLTPLLGITYMLVISIPYQWEYLHAILLSTQGFWVAMLYCFFNSEVQKSIRQHTTRWKAERSFGDSRNGSIAQSSRGNSLMPKVGRSSIGSCAYGSQRESVATDVSTMTSVLTNGAKNKYMSAPTSSPKSTRRQSRSTSLITSVDRDSMIPLEKSII